MTDQERNDLTDNLDSTIFHINEMLNSVDSYAHTITAPEQSDEFLSARRNLEASRDTFIAIKRYLWPEGLPDGRTDNPGPADVTPEAELAEAADQQAAADNEQPNDNEESATHAANQSEDS